MKDYVQVCNPITKKFVKIDRSIGAIVAHKRTKGPYKGVPIRGKRYDLINRPLGELNART